MTSDALLELREIGMVFASSGAEAVSVLVGVSLAVRRGELVAVAGRSGSGKTTLLNIAGAMLAPTSGSVLWGGTAVSSLRPRELAQLRGRQVGIVFQGAELIGSLTAAENVALPALPKGLREDGRERARSLLAGMGLGGRPRQFPSQLSGGERQRVAIARGLFADPSLLLVDEPTANLDRSNADAVIELLAALAADGKGLLVASHDEHLIRRADRVIGLESDGTAGQPRA